MVYNMHGGKSSNPYKKWHDTEDREAAERGGEVEYQPVIGILT